MQPPASGEREGCDVRLYVVPFCTRRVLCCSLYAVRVHRNDQSIRRELSIEPAPDTDRAEGALAPRWARHHGKNENQARHKSCTFSIRHRMRQRSSILARRRRILSLTSPLRRFSIATLRRRRRRCHRARVSRGSSFVLFCVSKNRCFSFLPLGWHALLLTNRTRARRNHQSITRVYLSLSLSLLIVIRSCKRSPGTNL